MDSGEESRLDDERNGQDNASEKDRKESSISAPGVIPEKKKKKQTVPFAQKASKKA